MGYWIINNATRPAKECKVWFVEEYDDGGRRLRKIGPAYSRKKAWRMLSGALVHIGSPIPTELDRSAKIVADMNLSWPYPITPRGKSAAMLKSNIPAKW